MVGASLSNEAYSPDLFRPRIAPSRRSVCQRIRQIWSDEHIIGSDDLNLQDDLAAPVI